MQMSQFDQQHILALLRDEPWESLRLKAEEKLLEHKGSHVFVRGLIEFSNRCHRNCLYCGLRAQNKNLSRYILTRDQILAAARHAAESGVDTIVLQSGEGACSAQWLAEIVKELKKNPGLPVTLSVGESSLEDYQLWRAAGADRYLIKHETADAGLYAALHPGYSLSERIYALKALRLQGYEIGSGFMTGLPGQSLESIAADIALMRELHVDMCGAGPFIAQGSTPLAGSPSGASELALRVLAVLRICLPWANLPATTALATVDPLSGQVNGLRAGANVLMPSFTPPEFASDYTIYDNKNRVSILNAAEAIHRAGRTCDLKPVRLN